MSPGREKAPTRAALVPPVAAALLVALVVAGCGSGGGAPAEHASPAERKAFALRADKLCEESTFKTLDERRAWERKHGIPLERPNQAQQEEEIVKFMAPAVLQRVRELEALPVPAGEEAQLRKFLDAFREAAERAEKNPSLQIGYPNIYTPVKELAQQVGFTACGTG